MAKLYDKEPWWLKVILLPMYPIWFMCGFMRGMVKAIRIAAKMIKSGVDPASDEFVKKMNQMAIDEVDK